MIIRADAKTFAEAAASAARIAASRATIPILSHVKIAAADGVVTLTAGDLDREIELTFAADVEAAGETTAPAHKLADALRAAPKGVVARLEASPAALKLTAGRARYALPVLPAADFPAIGQGGEFAPAMEFPGKVLAADLGEVGHAISTEETRYYLNGVFIDAAQADGLRFVATDGHRLMRLDTTVASKAASVILPAESVKQFARLAASAETVSLELSARMVRLTAGAQKLVSKVIDGTFPDYGRVVPTEFIHRAEFDAAALTESLARAAVACAERGQAVALDFSDGEIGVSARNADGFEAEDRLECKGGASVRIGFNAKYLGEAITALAAKRLRLEMGDPQGPAKLSDPDRGDRFVVLMPVRI